MSAKGSSRWTSSLGISDTTTKTSSPPCRGVCATAAGNGASPHRIPTSSTIRACRERICWHMGRSPLLRSRWKGQLIVPNVLLGGPMVRPDHAVVKERAGDLSAVCARGNRRLPHHGGKVPPRREEAKLLGGRASRQPLTAEGHEMRAARHVDTEAAPTVGTAQDGVPAGAGVPPP